MFFLRIRWEGIEGHNWAMSENFRNTSVRAVITDSICGIGVVPNNEENSSMLHKHFFLDNESVLPFALLCVKIICERRKLGNPSLLYNSEFGSVEITNGIFSVKTGKVCPIR